jgi:hypothetical protein
MDIDVFIPARPDMGEIALVDRVALPLELSNRFHHVHGVLYDDGIGGGYRPQGMHAKPRRRPGDAGLLGIQLDHIPDGGFVEGVPRSGDKGRQPAGTSCCPVLAVMTRSVGEAYSPPR